MTDLLIGPLLRYVGENCAVIWVETDGPCEVGVMGFREPTFHVEGHHYALVRVEDLEPGEIHEYTVELDGAQVWPPAGSDFPPSRFRTYPKKEALKISFGSCRVAAPHEPPYSLPKEEDERGRGIDALRTLALRMRKQSPDEWPDLLLLLGDQVYADECSPQTKEFIRSRRDTSEEPGAIALGFEEYASLYRESWTEPTIRWLLSTVSTAMIFDDHDVHDDWNTSAAWVDEMRATDWWDEHVVAALMSYWIYQHIGNLSPDEHAEDGLLKRLHEVEDGGPILREFAFKADREVEGTRWSYYRDLGDSRLVVIDSRCGRVLDEDRRSMLDDAEWQWLAEHATGGFEHLLLATSLPWLLAPAMHHLEAWNEHICGGAWGSLAAGVGEKIRQGLDLEHWAAFNESFDRLAELQRAVGAGERGDPPASIVTLSGDVHHAYLSEVAFRRGSGVKSAVYQATCSPMRNPLDLKERRVVEAAVRKPAHALARALSRSAGVKSEPVRWRQVGDSPWFDNQVATLELDGRRMDFRIEKVVPDEEEKPRLECVLEHRIA
ncbi:MAG TPA: alkaline phosphatase D family protein [Thermoleophilaceae bacterium]|nr:alkaline phosphatase D family protein [Thermoleophilaceae bacterium]